MKEMYNAPHSFHFYIHSSQKKGPSSLNCILIFMYHEREHLEDEGHISSVFHQSVSSVAQSCLCYPKDCSTPGLPVQHQLPEFTQTHVHWVGDAIQPSHPLSSPSPPTFNLSQHQGLFQWVTSLHQVAKVSEFQLHYQSFWWIFRTSFL